MAELDISIVIPTRDRSRTLARTLAAVGAQELAELQAEVIVVDNGSRDDTMAELNALSASYSLPLRTLERSEGVQGAARNLAISAVRGELVLFLGDDTPPARDDLVAGHVAAHRERPNPWRAVMGPCVWSPEIEVTPVMEWLARTGKSHDYSGLGREGAGRILLYTNNASLSHQALLAVDGFDERFPQYGWEDYDLALRLADHGLELAFRPELLVCHEHTYTVRSSLRRMEAVGQTANLLNRLHAGRPGLETPAPSGARAKIGRLIGRVASRVPVPAWLPRPVRDALFRVLHFSVMARGYAADSLPDDPALRGGIRELSVG